MANIVKRDSKLPAPVQALLKGIEPVGLAKTVGAFSGGFIAAQLGGALAKQVDAIEDFANGGVLQEVLVDAGAGLVLDGVATAALYATQGEEVAVKAAKLMVVGTVVGAGLPAAAPFIADGIEKVVDMIFGDSAKTATPPAGPAKPVTATTSRVGVTGVASKTTRLALAAPGGLYDIAPGGLYDLAGM